VRSGTSFWTTLGSFSARHPHRQQSGSENFQSAAELTALLQDLNHDQGPVELVLARDFLDLLRMGTLGAVKSK
jgi:hypothetical protein